MAASSIHIPLGGTTPAQISNPSSRVRQRAPMIRFIACARLTKSSRSTRPQIQAAAGRSRDTPIPTALQRLSSRQPGSSYTSRRRGISLSIRARWPTVPLSANWETLQETTLARLRRIVEAMFSSERLAAPCRRIRRSTRRLFPGGRLWPFYILADVVQATTASQCAAQYNPVGTGRQPLEA